jgi:UDP-GlcNAc:undecaprenyl-phosphate GlcNAc-1-phosphate transferase
VIALLLCLGAQPVARRLGLLDIPGGRKSHHHPTPLIGGLALLIGFYPWLAIWMWLDSDPFKVSLLPMVGCAAALTILGLIDDRRHLAAAFRLLICFTCIAVALWSAPLLVLRSISWNYGAGSIALGWTGALFTAVSIVALIQAANLADGKNGLLIGMCLAWLFFLGNRLPDSFNPMVLGLAGILIVLLAFNLAGKLFLGDGGSYGLATFIGFVALLTANQPRAHASSDQIALVFLLPVIDMIRLMITRLARRQSPFAGDRDHLHHHLLGAFGWPGGLAIYLMLVVAPSFVASGAPRNTLTIIALTVIVYFSIIAFARRVAHRRTVH